MPSRRKRLFAHLTHREIKLTSALIDGLRGAKGVGSSSVGTGAYECGTLLDRRAFRACLHLLPNAAATPFVRPTQMTGQGVRACSVSCICCLPHIGHVVNHDRGKS